MTAAQSILCHRFCPQGLTYPLPPSACPSPSTSPRLQDFFTVYFACDYGLRIYMAQDSLTWYFSLVSLLDWVTVMPMLVGWLITAGGEYDTNVAMVVQCIRVLRVLRIFRVTRFIRSLGTSQSFAFQRQVRATTDGSGQTPILAHHTLSHPPHLACTSTATSHLSIRPPFLSPLSQVAVLAMTVLSMVFVCGGIYQVFELAEWAAAPADKKPAYPTFHRAIYYATITVVGRPAIPITSQLSFVFLTGVVYLAATIIPTFVAELIRLWFDNASLETFSPNPEAPHVIVCGDTNVSRLRALAGQYFHRSRNPDALAPLVVLAEAKPEGALKGWIDQYKHSGLVRYIRGSARRGPDLKRAGIQGASAVLVLNYRADRDASSADTEVLSTVMAIKASRPGIRVLAQLARPRKRNHLKVVPGWHDSDKSMSAPSLSMTLVGLGTRIPGLPTLLTNLVRRGTALGLGASHTGRAHEVTAGTAKLLSVLYYGDRAKPAAQAALESLVNREAARRKPKTPLEEYAASVDQSLTELAVTPGLVGRTFASAARTAYLRYSVTLIGATVPINDDICALMPGLPRTFKVALFPSKCVLSLGQRLYVIAGDPTDVERLRIETGGHTRNVLQRVVGDIAGSIADVFKPQRLADEDEAGGDAYASAVGGTVAGGSPGSPQASQQQADHLAWLGTGPAVSEASYPHNAAAAVDVAIPWCFSELEGDVGGGLRSLLQGALPGVGHKHGHGEACEGCKHAATAPHPLSLLSGAGIVSLPGVAGAAPGPGDATDSEGDRAASPAPEESAPAPASASSAVSGSNGATEAITTPDGRVIAVISGAALAARKQSFGDDGLGGIDDTDDITGGAGTLATTAPSVHHSGGVAATAHAAARANINALAVRLTLPVAAAGTDVEGMAAEAKQRPPPFAGHVLVCGASDSMGYLLRAIASMLTMERSGGRGAGSASGSSASGSSSSEGDQYDLRASDVVVLAPAKPSDAALNAMYPGSAKLLARVTFLAGSPSEAGDLIRAGVMTARAAVVLTSAKSSGDDNLADDSDAIVTSSTLFKLNPGLHVISELLHGAHAPYLRPNGSTLNDAQRSSFVWVLEEREALRQRARLEDAIRHLASSSSSSSDPAVDEVSSLAGGAGEHERASVLLTKLSKQQVRLKVTSTAFAKRGRLLTGGGGGPAPPSRGEGASGSGTGFGSGMASAMAELDRTPGASGSSGLGDADLEQLASSGLSTAAIVDVLVGVREEFNGAAAAANDGAAFSMSGGAGGGGGASKGGASNDLFASPAYACGRAVSLTTSDALLAEAHFHAFVPGVLKQLIRAARHGRLVALPMTEAIVMAGMANSSGGGRAGGVTPASLARAREAYLSQLAHGILSAARGPAWAPEGAEGAQDASASSSSAGASSPSPVVRTYGELAEALLRGWDVLPMGLYRRVHPATGLRASPATVAALQLAAGPPTPGGAFAHNRALVSYVLTNPPPHTALSEHDLVYVLLPTHAGGGAVVLGEDEY